MVLTYVLIGALAGLCMVTALYLCHKDAQNTQTPQDYDDWINRSAF